MMEGEQAAVRREDDAWTDSPEASRIEEDSVSVVDWRVSLGGECCAGVRSGRTEHRLVDGDRRGVLGGCRWR